MVYEFGLVKHQKHRMKLVCLIFTLLVFTGASKWLKLKMLLMDPSSFLFQFAILSCLLQEILEVVIEVEIALKFGGIEALTIAY